MPATAEMPPTLGKQATVGTHVSAESPPTKGMPTTAARISAKGPA
jgi:hypothetical protein